LAAVLLPPSPPRDLVGDLVRDLGQAPRLRRSVPASTVCRASCWPAKSG